MKTRLFRLLCCLLLGASSVTAAQGCPYPSAVRYVDGHFQGPEERFAWISQPMGGQDFIDTFIGAIFVPREPGERRNGFLEKCIYKTIKGNTVALRYGATKHALSMSLTDTTHWQPGTDVFGQAIFQCDDRQPDNCSFTLETSRNSLLQ